MQPPCPAAAVGTWVIDAPAAIVDGRERAVCWSGWRGSGLEAEAVGIGLHPSPCPVSTLQGREWSGVQVTKVALPGRKIGKNKWILFALVQLDLTNHLSCSSATGRDTQPSVRLQTKLSQVLLQSPATFCKVFALLCCEITMYLHHISMKHHALDFSKPSSSKILKGAHPAANRPEKTQPALQANAAEPGGTWGGGECSLVAVQK